MGGQRRILHGPWTHREGRGGWWEAARTGAAGGDSQRLLSRGALDAFGVKRGGRGAHRGDRRREQREVRTAKRCVRADPTSGKGRSRSGDRQGLLVALCDQSDPVGRGRARVVLQGMGSSESPQDSTHRRKKQERGKLKVPQGRQQELRGSHQVALPCQGPPT